MEAYKTALENSGTTMVLSPDSEFFRFFQNEAGQPGERQALPARTATPTFDNTKDHPATPGKFG